jgi:hypothetical protein
MKAFVEGYVFAAAVTACEKAPSSTPLKWNDGKSTSIVGLSSVTLDKYTVVASYTLVADGVYCGYDPIKEESRYRIEFPRSGLGLSPFDCTGGNRQ